MKRFFGSNGQMVTPQGAATTQSERIIAAPVETGNEVPSWKTDPINQMLQIYRNLRVQNARMEAAISERAQTLQTKENDMAAESMKAVFPGGAPDLDKVISPFFYPFEGVEVAPGRTERVNVIISNEAPFIMMGHVKAIFRPTQDGPVYIDPEERDPTLPYAAPGLSFSIEDEGSTKPFMKTPIPASLVGNPQFPFIYPIGHLFLAKSSVLVTWTNEHPTNTYIPFLMLYGAKLYIDPKGTLGSLVSMR